MGRVDQVNLLVCIGKAQIVQFIWRLIRFGVTSALAAADIGPELFQDKSPQQQHPVTTVWLEDSTVRKNGKVLNSY